MQDILYILFRLLRTAIGTQIPELSPNDQQKFQELSLEQWNRLEALAHKQGVAAVSFDGFQQICAANPDLDLIIQDHDTDLTIFNWNSHLAATERQYEQNANAIKQLSGLLEPHGIKTMVFKGYSLSLEYPIPQHRECGDVDAYFFGNWNKVDQIIAKILNHNIFTDNDKHSKFSIGNKTIENHRSFLNCIKVPSLSELEERLEKEAQLAKDENGIYKPTTTFNTLFLPVHSALHFIFGGSNARHLIDWALFLRNHGNQIPWEQAVHYAKQAGYHNYLLAINAIAIKHFHIPAETIPHTITEETYNKILYNTISNTQPEKEELSSAARLLKKIKQRKRFKLVFNYPFELFLIRRSCHYMKQCLKLK